jgi:hypothetical protein
MDSPILYDDTIIYEVEVWGGRVGAKSAFGVFAERRTAEAWIRSLGDGVENRITQKHLLDTRRHYNMSITEPDLSNELPGRELPPPNFSTGLPPRRFSPALT